MIWWYDMIYAFVTRHKVAILRYRGADGIPWWSPTPVLATNYCVCNASVYCFSGIYYRSPSWEQGNFLSVITTGTTGHSKFLQCHTDHLTSLCAGDRIDSINKSLEYRRRWGATLSPPASQASVLATCSLFMDDWRATASDAVSCHYQQIRDVNKCRV